MNTEADNIPEVQSNETDAIARTADVVTVRVEDARLRNIVSDEHEDSEKRSLAYEATSARTAIAILLAIGVSDAHSVRAAVLEVLEAKCSSYALDDESDRNATADAITAALTGAQ